MERVHLALVRCHDTDFIKFIGFATGHQQNLIFTGNCATYYPEINYYTPIGIVIGIKNQRPQRFCWPIGGWGHPIHDRLQDFSNSQACFGGTGDGVAGV